MSGSVAASKWDTWTRSEIMAVRGYPSSQAISPVLVTQAGPAMVTAVSLEATNGTAPPGTKPSVVTTPVATNGTSELLNGSVALATPEALPEDAEETTGLSTGDRSCIECGEPLPEASRLSRVVCSQRCRQRRHDRMRKPRVRPTAKALPLATVPAPPKAEAAGAVAVVPGGHEGCVLDAVVRLSTRLPEGWRVEIEAGTVTLSWHASYSE